MKVNHGGWKERTLVNERNATAGRHALLNVSLLKESFDARMSGMDHYSTSTINSNHSYSMYTLIRCILL